MEQPLPPASFPEFHAAAVAKAKPRSISRLWAYPIMIGVFIFLLTFGYILLQEGAVKASVINRSFAVTATVLIGFSFSLSGLCYFWNVMDSKIVYRKYLGLTGFFFGLTHALLSLYYYFIASDGTSAYTFFHTWDVFGVPVSNVVPFIFGLTALLIFIMMASISNRYATMALGGVRWRRMLRTGYLAFLFLIVHYGVKNAEEWGMWITRQQPHWLPPISLPLFVFALLVLGLRAALFVAEPRTQPRSNTTATSSPPSQGGVGGG